MNLKRIFCSHCGVSAWIINGDRSLFLGHLRRVHRSH